MVAPNHNKGAKVPTCARRVSQPASQSADTSQSRFLSRGTRPMGGGGREQRTYTTTTTATSSSGKEKQNRLCTSLDSTRRFDFLFSSRHLLFIVNRHRRAPVAIAAPPPRHRGELRPRRSAGRTLRADRMLLLLLLHKDGGGKNGREMTGR